MQRDTDNYISMEQWEPAKKEEKIVQSQWRKNQVNENYERQPCLDDLRKINVFIKKKIPDHEIMRTFGINSDVMIAIKRKKYCPVEGIKLDNLCKIYIEFEKISKKINKIKRGNDYLASILLISDEEKTKYDNYCKTNADNINTIKKTRKKKYNPIS